MSSKHGATLRKLSAEEQEQLENHERIIETGRMSFTAMGEALLNIRDGKLYRDRYTTFDKYCKERWEISRVHAHRLIEASEVVRMLPMGNKITSERQARELVKVPVDRWEEVIDLVMDEDGTLTAKGIKKAVTELTGPSSTLPSWDWEIELVRIRKFLLKQFDNTPACELSAFRQAVIDELTKRHDETDPKSNACEGDRE